MATGSQPLVEPDVPTPDQIVLIRQHLKQVLDSHVFAGGKRTQDFLKLIVSHALEGEFDQLRERMIGAEMFGRPIGYDTGSDSVVRVKATDLRKRLAQYYAEAKESPLVRIELPSGSYIPRFHFEPVAPSASAISHSSDSELVAASHTVPVEPQSLAAAAGGTAERARRTPAGIFISLGALIGMVLLVAATAILAYMGIRKWLSEAPVRPKMYSIVILPLENLSGDPRQDYFADGMTEELINDLGQISTLRVISLTSSMSYKDTHKTLPEIARELSVDAVVEGGILREGNGIRISIQLIDARTDQPIMAHTYVRDLTNVHAWQGEVAQAIVDEISIKATPQEQARLARYRPIDPAAQDIYLHGMRQLEADNCGSAIDYFNQALAVDSNFAQAHAALANCYGRMGESGHMAYGEAFRMQKAEAIQAIELDDSLPEGHAELANTEMSLDWDWAAADAQFNRALELNPNSAPIHEKYAFYLVRTGQLNKALAEAARGIDLDPVTWHSFHADGFICYFSRHYSDALSLIKKVHALNINPPDWSFLLGDVYAEQGRLPEAIAEFIKSGNGPDSLGHLGNAYARSGHTAEALKTVAELEQHVKQNGVGRYEIALVYTGLGEKQQAFTWLEGAAAAHDVGLLYLKVDPCLDPLRSDPRFDELLRRVGLANS